MTLQRCRDADSAEAPRRVASVNRRRDQLRPVGPKGNPARNKQENTPFPHRIIHKRKLRLIIACVMRWQLSICPIGFGFLDNKN